ncbi:MAG TPA: hypothetical protein VES67_04045 [Vicinamibacterales bacterium]|nr:hypothetical protein [Vicinamibacterales bacterium]
MATRSSLRVIVAFATFAFALAAAFCLARVQAHAQVATVPALALEQLLPAPAGWTRVDVKSDKVVISADCSHPVAVANYVRGEMQMRITLADSALHADSLTALAPMIVMLPDGYSERVPPATRITRLQHDGAQVAERWDDQTANGEITMLVKGRFVASIEGSHLDSLDTLRKVLGEIDLKKLAELK